MNLENVFSPFFNMSDGVKQERMLNVKVNASFITKEFTSKTLNLMSFMFYKIS